MFCADVEAPNRFNLANGIDASGITINTLTVLGPEGSVEQFAARNVVGPDEPRVRLALNKNSQQAARSGNNCKSDPSKPDMLGKPFRATKRK